MTTQDKEQFIFRLIDVSTGDPDTGLHTVKIQPINQTFPTGAIDCSHVGNGYYIPDSDFNNEMHYDIYVDGTKKRRRLSDNSFPGLS